MASSNPGMAKRIAPRLDARNRRDRDLLIAAFCCMLPTDIIDGLNAINGGVPPLDSTNTAAEPLAALVAAQADLPTANDNVDFLVDIMSVENPAYFDSTTCQSYGPSAPSGWPSLSDAEAQALLPSGAQAAVDSMDIAFEDDSPPGF